MSDDLRDEELLKAIREGIEAEPQWLVVLDGADNLATFDIDIWSNNSHVSERLLDYIPCSRTGSVIWTSCDKMILDIVGGGTNAILLRQMTPGEACMLFEIARNQETKTTDATHLEVLLNELDWLPLAIFQAGCFLGKTATSIDGYLSELAHLAWCSKVVNDYATWSESYLSSNLLRVWIISTRYIYQHSEVAYAILHTLAYFSSQDITSELVEAAVSNNLSRKGDTPSTRLQEIETAVVLLQEVSFMRSSMNELGELRYSIHKTTQEAARIASATVINILKTSITQGSNPNLQVTSSIGSDQSLNSFAPESTNSPFFHTAIKIVTNPIHDNARRSINRYGNYLIHTLQLSYTAEKQGRKREAAELFMLLSGYFSKQQAWRDMETVVRKSLELRTEVLGEKHTDTLWSFGTLASSLYAQARYKEAAEMFSHSWALRHEVLGAIHPHTIWSMSFLAIAYGMQGQYREAESIFVPLLALKQELLGKRHLDTMATMCNLAVTYYGLCRYDETEEMLNFVLAFRMEVLGGNHPETSRARHNLSVVRQTRLALASRLS